MADDVAEADFYLSQGMLEEARVVLLRMQEGRPRHPAVATLAARIARASEGSTPPPQPPPAVPAPAAAGAADPCRGIRSSRSRNRPFGRLRALPARDRAQIHRDRCPDGAGRGGLRQPGSGARRGVGGRRSVCDLSERRPAGGWVAEGVPEGGPEQLDEKDYETHYNLGIAYKEMELYNEAIEEFRLTAREPKRALECADLVGLCYLAKGQPEQAIQGMQAAGDRRYPPGAYHSFRYDLGTAYEKLGDLGTALEQFEILQSEGAPFAISRRGSRRCVGEWGRPPVPRRSTRRRPERRRSPSI